MTEEILHSGLTTALTVQVAAMCNQKILEVHIRRCWGVRISCTHRCRGSVKQCRWFNEEAWPCFFTPFTFLGKWPADLSVFAKNKNHLYVSWNLMFWSIPCPRIQCYCVLLVFIAQVWRSGMQTLHVMKADWLWFDWLSLVVILKIGRFLLIKTFNSTSDRSDVVITVWL